MASRGGGRKMVAEGDGGSGSNWSKSTATAAGSCLAVKQRSRTTAWEGVAGGCGGARDYC